MSVTHYYSESKRQLMPIAEMALPHLRNALAKLLAGPPQDGMMRDAADVAEALSAEITRREEAMAAAGAPPDDADSFGEGA